MSFENSLADDRYELDQCIDEIKRLKEQLAASNERAEAANRTIDKVYRILGGTPELNMANYSEEDVADLHDCASKAFLVLKSHRSRNEPQQPPTGEEGH